MLRILLGVIYFILLVIGGVLSFLGISSLQKAQEKNDDTLFRKAVTCFKLLILTMAVTGIYFIICLVLLS